MGFVDGPGSDGVGTGGLESGPGPGELPPPPGVADADAPPGAGPPLPEGWGIAEPEVPGPGPAGSPCGGAARRGAGGLGQYGAGGVGGGGRAGYAAGRDLCGCAVAGGGLYLDLVGLLLVALAEPGQQGRGGVAADEGDDERHGVAGAGDGQDPAESAELLAAAAALVDEDRPVGGILDGRTGIPRSPGKQIPQYSAKAVQLDRHLVRLMRMTDTGIFLPIFHCCTHIPHWLKSSVRTTARTLLDWVPTQPAHPLPHSPGPRM